MMAGWYSTNYLMRVPVSVPVLGGSGSAGTYDMSWTVPKDWDLFWSNIRSDAFDVIVTDADNNIATFKRASFTFSTRTLDMAVDNLNVENNNSVNLIWMYFGFSGATDLASVFTPSTPKTGTIYLGAPTNRIVGYVNPQSTATDTPTVSFTKASDESVFVWFNTGAYFAKRRTPYNNIKFLEGIKFVDGIVHPKAGTSSTLTIDKDKTRFINNWTGLFIEAGTDATNYTLELKVTTTRNQIISLRCGISVRDKIPV